MALSTPAGLGGDVAVQLTEAAFTKRKADVRGIAFRTALQIGLSISVIILVVLLVDVVTGGWSVLSTRLGDFLTSTLSSNPAKAGVQQSLAGSLWTSVCVVVLAFPVGIGAAIYLEEYAPRNRFTKFIELNVRNLAGVPSVVYGILGLTIFVQAMEGVTGGKTALAGGLTLAALVLPIVIITASEAIRAVPESIREGGYGVGATKWEIIRTFVLPYAAPGIITGTILSLARALGEAAPLLLVGAVQGRLPNDDPIWDPSWLTERFTAMPVTVADWASRPEQEFVANTAAAIVVLLVVVLLANMTAILLRNRYEKKRHG
jgi:phosphate transport system permease protein